MKKNKILFFDRDGILINTKRINNRPIAINNIKNIKFCYGIKKIIKLSRENNYINIMVTNKPDISRKKINKKKVDNINEYIKKKLSLDDVFMCGHDDKDYCDCRKPKTGMLIKAKKKWVGDFKKSIIDEILALRGKCTIFLVTHNKNLTINCDEKYLVNNKNIIPI